MAVNDRTASSRQLAAHWSTATGVLMSASSIRQHLLHHGLRAKPEVVPFLQDIPGAIFQQDNAFPHVAKTVQDFCSAQHMQLVPWSANLLDISPIKHVWDWLVGISHVIHVLQLQKTQLLLRIQVISNSLPQADIQNLFDSMPCRTAALIAAHGGYIKY
ncbi:UNVERIFIED_CONTAM: Transposable element Tcb2 transposase [Trichonephila clavipes]